MFSYNIVNQLNQTSFYEQIEQLITNVSITKIISIFGQVFIVIIFFLAIHSTVSTLIDRVQKRRKIEKRITRQIKLFSNYIIGTIGLLTILGVLGIDLTLIATSLGIAGIAVGFAARDLLSNLISGIFILIDRTYLVNDAVIISDTYGIVRLITLRNTEIKTFDGNIVIIPNSQVASGKIVNMTSGSNLMLSSVSVNISYDEEYQKVKDLMKEVLNDIQGVYINESYKVMFRVEELEERLQGVEVEMYFTVNARNEPWIKGEVYEKVLSNLVRNKVKFHRQAPNAEPEYGREE